MGPKRNHSAFTLIELLVVVAIIVILISIMLPSLGRAREQGKSAQCLANLHQIGLAAASYQSEWDGAVPWVKPSTHNGGDGEYSTGGCPSPHSFFNAINTDGRIPAPQNRVVNRYMAPSYQNATLNGTAYIGLWYNKAFICPSDMGEALIWNDWSPQLWKFTGSSYRYNDNPQDWVNGLPNAIPADFNTSKTIWNKKALNLPPNLLMYTEPPAQIWQWSGAMFHWHPYGATGGTTYMNSGQQDGRPFISNALFVNGSARAVDFSPNFKRSAGRVVSCTIENTTDFCWYAP